MLRFYDVATRTQLGDPIDTRPSSANRRPVLRRDGLQAAVGHQPGHRRLGPRPRPLGRSRPAELAGRNLTHAEWDQYIGDLAPYRRTCPGYIAA